jgi:hypothetical protein
VHKRQSPVWRVDNAQHQLRSCTWRSVGHHTLYQRSLKSQRMGIPTTPRCTAPPLSAALWQCQHAHRTRSRTPTTDKYDGRATQSPHQHRSTNTTTNTSSLVDRNATYDCTNKRDDAPTPPPWTHSSSDLKSKKNISEKIWIWQESNQSRMMSGMLAR